MYGRYSGYDDILLIVRTRFHRVRFNSVVADEWNSRAAAFSFVWRDRVWFTVSNNKRKKKKDFQQNDCCCHLLEWPYRDRRSLDYGSRRVKIESKRLRRQFLMHEKLLNVTQILCVLLHNRFVFCIFFLFFSGHCRFTMIDDSGWGQTILTIIVLVE